LPNVSGVGRKTFPTPLGSQFPVIDKALSDSAYVSQRRPEQDNRFQRDSHQQQIIPILIG
jgi:hypothetical protein